MLHGDKRETTQISLNGPKLTPLGDRSNIPSKGTGTSQPSCRKVMFSQACVSLSREGPFPQNHTPKDHTPLQGHTPWTIPIPDTDIW